MIEKNEKKPFYKRNWFWITIFSIFIIVSATTYFANFSGYQGKADQASTKQSKSLTNESTKKNPSLIQKYNSIKTGKRGFSKKAIMDLLGQPSSMQQIEAGADLYSLTWDSTSDNNNVTIQVTVQNNKAIAKSIQGLDIDRKKLLTLDDFKQLQIGDKYNQVLDVLGDPDEYSDVDGIKTLVYESDLAQADPELDAVIKIDISNNKIISENQQNLK
ncbi:DUF3862 domain-containing protein [Companilactobacillus halodurans]|uniref:DUF3862 domain-containing protein n=1 Tax=Companilactobacillus halodurans TaxID=2584183 RepID=A0A5P0ZRP9_9LACO|nr:DUF3862 domain-containing protein [Companilactobacillus halodurans]MQS76735.1 DUF3862 domain-containing protein [Companilactobacillus halodurans]MQS97497.1 DUF3862 domain-containing protein [Companilactobacillus halodurans]